MPTLIHPTAIVSPGARIADDVQVGPYSVIGENVVIGPGTVVGPHCVIDGHTTVGANNNFYRFCSIGGMPQDKKYPGKPTRRTDRRREGTEWVSTCGSMGEPDNKK